MPHSLMILEAAGCSQVYTFAEAPAAEQTTAAPSTARAIRQRRWCCAASSPETDEERKARLAARPELTEAEKISTLEAQLAKRKAALTAGSSTPPAAQPLKAWKEQTRVVVTGKAAAAKGKGKK
jgi:uncharacterized protein YceK